MVRTRLACASRLVETAGDKQHPVCSSSRRNLSSTVKTNDTSLPPPCFFSSSFSFFFVLLPSLALDLDLEIASPWLNQSEIFSPAIINSGWKARAAHCVALYKRPVVAPISRAEKYALEWMDLSSRSIRWNFQSSAEFVGLIKGRRVRESLLSVSSCSDKIRTAFIGRIRSISRVLYFLVSIIPAR